MWCPRCEQGEIVKAQIKSNKNTIYVCEECEAMWLNPRDIGTKPHVDFGCYMKSIDLKPLWSELIIMN